MTSATSSGPGALATARPPALGGAIPAMPLLLGADGRIDWRAQRAVVRYHLAAGVAGLAVGVHTTQFELHDDRVLLCDVWELVHDELAASGLDATLVAGVSGDTDQAVAEAEAAASLGYRAVLLSSRGAPDAGEDAILDRAAAVGAALPTIGFYLQESVGGRYLSPRFWQRLVEQPTCIGVKAAPFDRYRTRDVASAILTSDRWRDVALLTGNDDAIVADLVTPHRRVVGGVERELRCAGGLLGQFAVGTRAAAQLTQRCLAASDASPDLLALGQDLTEVNAAVFDVVHQFAGCVAGVNEVLRQQGLAPSARCLAPTERVSPGQADLIAAARRRFPDLLDEDFIAEHRDAWLS
ncbi:dihydrodipicolinate synthase family protein [Propioniciclava soli]|uniref:Dihydrodipicolinate synthase family protein n=1 Tax=Propioniciclava soli TaxID=2775081 RepID=A0ABZ3CAT2_9ACTN